MEAKIVSKTLAFSTILIWLMAHYSSLHFKINFMFHSINPWRYSSDEPWPAEQPPLAVFPDCTTRYWVARGQHI
jgi:hypothetical protein